eukprot:Skav204958  [mRNA]  locus=scaffold3104:471319:487108:+ [translate_table: standard]
MRNYTVQHMYALESPRPGNKFFAQKLREMIDARSIDAWRVTHYQDLVPHLPPRGTFGYVHALPEIYYDSKNGTHYLECKEEDSNCSNRWWPWQLTAADHDWYAQIDPCRCPRGISKPQAAASSTTLMMRLMLIFG